MSFDYAATAADAATLLLEFGRGASLVREGPATYDPSTSTSTPAFTKTYPVTAFESQSERSFISGALIEAGHCAYLLAATGLAITPAAGDTFNWTAGRPSKVAKVLTLAPAGVAVIHEIHVLN